MEDIVLFEPKSGLDRGRNLANFISFCRYRLTVFGADLEWEAPCWPGVTRFCKLSVGKRKLLRQDDILEAPFIDFAKAYVRYSHGLNPRTVVYELPALRAIEAALIEITGGANVVNLSIPVLDLAADLVRPRFSESRVFVHGCVIANIVKFCVEMGFVAAGLQWRNPIRYRLGDIHRTDSKGALARNKRLPDEAALSAIAEVFAGDPSYDRDIYTTSIVALLLSAPSRISEVLSLPVNCEVTQVDKNGVERYGLRFYAAKGFGPDIKWVPTSMVEICRTAVARLRKLSEGARNFASWVEANDDSVFRHPLTPDVCDDEPLSGQEAAQALCYRNTGSLRNHGLTGKSGVHTLRTLSRWLKDRDRLPDDFPFCDRQKGIKYSEALCALHRSQLAARKQTSYCRLLPIDSSAIDRELSVGESSFFRRHGLKGENGEYLSLRTHAPRHLLNTIAQRGGLSQMEIAKWSGRANIGQNRAYNHMTEYELVKQSELIDLNEEILGLDGEPLGTPVSSSQEFNALTTGAVHVTEYGYCVHDYVVSPCMKYRDCLNCSEQICVKGNAQKLTRMKEELSRIEALLANARQAVEDGDFGADKWYEQHEDTKRRLQGLISIMESPELEDGAQIRLRGNDFSQLRRVLEKKCADAKRLNHEDAQMLEEVIGFMGGGIGG